MVRAWESFSGSMAGELERKGVEAEKWESFGAGDGNWTQPEMLSKTTYSAADGTLDAATSVVGTERARAYQ